MKLLRRNLTSFDYKECLGQEEVVTNDRHTGRYETKYADPVAMVGFISLSRGFIANQWYGIDDRYTHTLLMEDPNAPIKEDGLIIWKGDTYEIRAVRPSLNMLSAVLRKMPKEAETGA